MSALRADAAAARTAGPAPANPDDAQRIMDDIRRIVRELHSSTRSSEAGFGVTSAQLFILRQLQARPGLSMGEVAVRTRTSLSSVSEVVTRLVRHGLVDRKESATDRRRAELVLTADGRAVTTRAPETIQERLVHGLEQLETAQRRALADAMDAWLRAAGLAEVTPTMFFEP